MQAQHENPSFRFSKLLRESSSLLAPSPPLKFVRRLNAESLTGRHEGRARKVAGGSPKTALSGQLQMRVGRSAQLGRHRTKRGNFAYDPRQRAVVKVHYFNHAGAGGGALRAHARYLARDAAGERTPEHSAASEREGGEDRRQGREPSRESGVFYDAAGDKVDGAARAAQWAREDRRHFRLILSAENGARLRDLRAYTRAVMARAERALNVRLDWIAVDHWDTDNPHTHIIVRGRRADGRDLVIPREFVSHGFRSAARDAATARLGNRDRGDARRALERAALTHGPTRLDPMIADQLDRAGRIRLASLRAPDGSPEVENALRARAHELRRLGLAHEVERNIFQFVPGWQKALKAMELHLDVRKALMQARTQEIQKSLERSIGMKRSKGLGPDR